MFKLKSDQKSYRNLVGVVASNVHWHSGPKEKQDDGWSKNQFCVFSMYMMKHSWLAEQRDLEGKGSLTPRIFHKDSFLLLNFYFYSSTLKALKMYFVSECGKSVL